MAKHDTSFSGYSDHKNPGLVEIDGSLLFRILRNTEGPLMESTLLKKVTGLNSLPAGSEKLFTLHFSLFHLLYRLKEIHGPGGYYFHLDPMRIRMIEIPGSGYCRFYYPERGSFCPRESADTGYCSLHSGSVKPDERLITFDPLRDFYTNPGNISFSREEIFGKLMNGFILYSMKKGAVDDALKFFRITRPTRKTIQKRYHKLALTMHPDRNSGNDVLMKKLNSSYQVLMEVFVV